jgi:hypothetical protein
VHRRRPTRRWLVLAAILTLALGLVAAYTAQATPSQSGSDPESTNFAQIYAASRHIPANAVSAIAPGTLHTGAYDGTSWATASFEPASSDGLAFGLRQVGVAAGRRHA